MTETTLTLVQASKSRGGRWSKDDYDVYDGKRVIGRIMLDPQALKDRRCSWTLTEGGGLPSVSDGGYAESREQAMQISRCGGKAKSVEKLDQSIKNPKGPAATRSIDGTF